MLSGGLSRLSLWDYLIMEAKQGIPTLALAGSKTNRSSAVHASGGRNGPEKSRLRRSAHSKNGQQKRSIDNNTTAPTIASTAYLSSFRLWHLIAKPARSVAFLAMSRKWIYP